MPHESHFKTIIELFRIKVVEPIRSTTRPQRQAALEAAGRLKVVKLNVDENPVTAERFQVRSIPTLILFKGGVVVDQVVGALPKGPLKSRLEGFV